MKRLLIIGYCLFFVVSVFAGEKLTVRDASGSGFRGETMGKVTPLADGESYAKVSDGMDKILKYSFKTGEQTGVIFDAATAKGPKIGNVEDFIMSPDGNRILIQTGSDPIYRHSFKALYYIYNVRNNRLDPLSDNGPQQAPVWSPDGLQIAFVRDNNIFIVKLLYDNAEVQITKDGKHNELINGIPDWVNEEEFALYSAMVFTADSKQLVWVKYNESKVHEFSFPLFKGCQPEKQEYAQYPGLYTYKYPIAGEQNANVSVWSFDIASRQTRQLQLPIDNDGYIPRILPTDDAQQVAVFTLNRHQDCLRIFMCNPLSTVCKQVVEEKAARYVREATIAGIRITKGHILVPSDRTGYMHLDLYNIYGQKLRQVDFGDCEVTQVYGYDEATGSTYYASNEAGATEQQVWVTTEKGDRKLLTPKNGWNKAVFSKNYKYFIHEWSDLNTPPVTTLCDANGKELKTLFDNHGLKAKLSRYNMGSRELFQITTQDGITLNGWIIKPASFNPQRRYPVVMYQYGGPGNQQVVNAWGIGINRQGAILEQYLAQQDIISVCIDNRGTGGRGVEFEKCTYQRLGQLEAHDQVEAALWLAHQSYVDLNHIAIWGWSYGGFNTLMAMSEGRNAFCCGIAIAPPTSWRYYDTIYTERFMRTPQENPMGYDDCPISRVQKLHGALLLCHGMADDNVHFRNTAEYTAALVEADKDFSQLVYTNRNHSIYGGNTRHHLFRQCIDFFKMHLRE